MDPYPWPEKFNDTYDCMQFGYEESKKKMAEIGRSDVNKHGIFLRFTCTPITETGQQCDCCIYVTTYSHLLPFSAYIL